MVPWVRRPLIRANKAPWFKHEFKRCQPLAWHGCHSALGGCAYYSEEQGHSAPIPRGQRRFNQMIMCSTIPNTTYCRVADMGPCLSVCPDQVKRTHAWHGRPSTRARGLRMGGLGTVAKMPSQPSWLYMGMDWEGAQRKQKWAGGFWFWIIWGTLVAADYSRECSRCRVDQGFILAFLQPRLSK
jgi:hypothetical protein